MKKSLLILPLLLISTGINAAGSSSVDLYKSYNNLADVDSLRRGAELFTNRCASCHSIKYLRYSTIAEKLGWSEEEIEQKLIRGRANLQDIYVGGLNEKAAIATYGNPVPDLSLVAKYRSPDWIFTYLQGYYIDDNGKTDNFVYPGTAMPNLLLGDQGNRKAVFKEIDGKKVVVGTQPAKKPTSQAEKIKLEEKQARFNQITRDLTNFLEFASEPNKLDRQALGIKVILFLLVLLIILFFLKKEYWRDIKK